MSHMAIVHTHIMSPFTRDCVYVTFTVGSHGSKSGIRDNSVRTMNKVCML